MSTELDYLWQRRHTLLYRAELSTLYHRKREKFFDGSDRCLKMVTVVAGAAAVARLAGESASLVFAACASLAGATGLVFGLSERARRHADLSNGHGQLCAAIAAAGERSYSEADLNRWYGQLAQLEAGEPRSLAALTRQCQNELAIALDEPDKVFPLPWHQRALLQFMSFDANRSLL